MTPTPEQSAILDADRTGANLMINALAGTGKSATLKMIDKANRKPKSRLYLVFGKDNAREAYEAQKADEFASITKIKTSNSCGLGIWRDTITAPIVLDKSKFKTMWNEMTEQMTWAERGAVSADYTPVKNGFEMAKSLGYVPSHCQFPHKSLCDRATVIAHMDEEPSDYVLALIDDFLIASIVRAYDGDIDFDDQVYMPALFNAKCPRFATIMVDEYQDQNPVNHALIDKLITERIIGVGDPYQNIFGFRGAQAEGMIDAISRYNMRQLPLSVSFRCPSAIVEAARWRVPEFKWSKQGGSVRDANQFSHTEFADDSTVICRNNAPLLRLAFRLISVGRSVSVVGSELGPRLVAIMKKFGDATMPRSALFTAIEEWREQKLMAGSKSASDLADCLRVFADHGDTLGSAISYAEHIFAQRGTIRLLTIHKSKGLEFDNLFWLDPGLLDLAKTQEQNLAYVAITRSQNSLTKLDSSAILW